MMDPKSDFAKQELKLVFIIDVLDKNCEESIRDALLNRTSLAKANETYAIKEFFTILDKYGFHWTDKTPGRIKDYIKKWHKDKLQNET